MKRYLLPANEGTRKLLVWSLKILSVIVSHAEKMCVVHTWDLVEGVVGGSGAAVLIAVLVVIFCCDAIGHLGCDVGVLFEGKLSSMRCVSCIGGVGACGGNVSAS